MYKRKEGWLVHSTPDDIDGVRVPNTDEAQRHIHCVWSQDPALSSRRVEVVVVQVGLLLRQMKNCRKIMNMRKTYPGECA